MRFLRPVALVLILVSGGAFITVLFVGRVETPLKTSLAPLFQMLGEPVRGVDEAASKVLPVNEYDEKEYGERIAAYYKSRTDTGDSTYKYINGVLNNISSFSSKPFRYQAFILNTRYPNACAFPGGVILITQGLLDVLKTEGQVAAVLAHEMGHIECGHCFNAVKYELLTDKIDIPNVGSLADMLNRLFFRHSYSKTQEAEADLFSYKTILRTVYTPSSVAGAFHCLREYHEDRGSGTDGESADVLRDYFMSHPPLRLRVAKYEAEAERWWEKNPGVERYKGKRNLVERVPVSVRKWDGEWIDSTEGYGSSRRGM